MKGYRSFLGIVSISAMCCAAYVAGNVRRFPRSESRPVVDRAPATLSDTSELSYVGFHPKEIDLGQHLWGTEVPFELSFQNPDVSDLSVRSVEANCDCVIFETDALAGRIVPGRGDLSIAGTVNTGRHPGVLRRIVMLTDQTEKTYSSHIILETIGTWKVTKDAVDFGTVILGAPSTPSHLEDTFQFISQENELIDELDYDESWLSCVSAHREDGVTDVLVRVNPLKLLPGVNTAQIGFRTNSEVRPDGMVYVRLKALSALRSIPSTVSIIGRESCSARIVALNDAAVKIARVSVSNSDLSCHIIGDCDINISSRCITTPPESYAVTAYDDLGNWVVIPVSIYAPKE